MKVIDFNRDTPEKLIRIQQQVKPSFLDELQIKIGKQNIAYILITFGSCLFMSGFIYVNQHNFNVFQTALSRGIAVVILNFIIIRYLKLDMDFKHSDNLFNLNVRNIIVTLQGLIYTLSNFYLPLPIVSTINSTGPIFVFILDYYINGTTIGRSQFYGIIIGMIGVIFTVNGGLMLSYLDESYIQNTDFQHYKSTDPFVQAIISIIFTVSMIFWAYAIIITKRLREVSSFQINIHLGICILISTGVIYPMQVRQAVSVVDFIKSLFLSGLAMAISQIAFIKSLTMTKNSGVLTMLMFTAVILGYIVSTVRYGQSINPISSIGTVLICFGLSKIVLYKKKQQIIGDISPKGTK